MRKKIVLIIGTILLILSITVPVKAEWYQHEGKGYVVCDAILKRLNSYKSKTAKEAKECAWDVVASYPGFKEPPWQELDAKKHEDLIFKLLKYRACGVNGYFGRGPCQISYTDESLHKETRRFIAEGGRIHLWRTRLLDWFEISENLPTPPGPQTVIQLRWGRDIELEKKRCPGKPVVDWWIGGLYIVADDLSGPHPQVNSSNASSLESKTAFFFSNKLHYVAGSSGYVVIGIDRGGWSMPSFCDIRYK